MASTSTSTPEAKETMRLLRRVLRKCEEERQKDGQQIYKIPDNHLDRAVRYTGMYKNALQDLMTTPEIKVSCKPIDRCVIRNALLKYYFTKRTLPTTRQLFNALENEVPSYFDIAMLRRLLLKMGYVWKKMPSGALVIMEKPTVTFERYNYLKKIIEYRKKNMPIIYVDENYFPVDNKFYFNLADDMKYLKDNIDPLKHVIYAVCSTGIHFVKFNDQFGSDLFENWVKEYLTRLPSPSVVVLRNMKHNSTEIVSLPTRESISQDMRDWLDYHRIPYSGSMAKFELYSLIEKYTDITERIYKIDNILKLHDHIVLRIPESINKLTAASLVRELIQKNAQQLPNDIPTIITSVMAEHVVNFENFIAAEEETILKNDLDLDNIFDDLTYDFKYTAVPENEDVDSDFPSASDSE